MTSSSVIPDTDSYQVAALAVAWEIVRHVARGSLSYNTKENVANLTNMVVDITASLTSLEKLNPKSEV